MHVLLAFLLAASLAPHPAFCSYLSSFSGRLEIISEPLLKREMRSVANGGRDKYCLRINSTRILLLHPTLHHDLGDLTTGMQLTVRGEHLDSTRRLHTSHGSMTRSTDSNSVHTSIHTVESSAMDVHEVVVHHHLSPEEVSGDEHEATTSAVARRSLASTPQPLKATGSVSAIVVRVSQCGGSIQPSFTISDIYGAFFPGFQPKNLFSGQSNLNPLQSYTYQDAYSKCSYGQSSISQAKINIVPQTIDICSPSGQPFEICSDDMLPSIGTLVNSHLQSAGYDTTKYDRVIMFLPAPSTCPILGWGTVGCTKGTPCSVWGMAADVTLLMHESSHNFGLNHAQGYGSYDPSTGSWVNEEYGDVSCSMASVPFVCYNAPNSWRLGWSTPIKTLDSSSLPQGQPITLTLPDALSTSTNFVRVVFNWAPGSPSLFLSFRPNHAPYEQLEPMVYLHTLPCEQSTVPTANQPCKTNLTGYLPESGLWLDSTLGIRVSVDSVSGTSATVTICRSNSPCTNEPQLYYTIASKPYGWPGYRFYTNVQPAQPVGFWSDVGQGALTGLIAWGSPNLGGDSQIVAVQSLFGAGGAVSGTIRGDGSATLSSGLTKQATATLTTGELFVRAFIQADSVSGIIYSIALVTSKGRTFTLGHCGPTCQSTSSLSTVVPPPYANGKQMVLAGFHGASSRYLSDHTKSFVSQLAFVWMPSNTLAQIDSPPPVQPLPPSPPPPSLTPVITYPLLDDSFSFYWDTTAPPSLSGIFNHNATSTYLENGPITKLQIIVMTDSLLTDGPSLVGIVATYGSVKGPTWGLSSPPNLVDYTSQTLNLNHGENIVGLQVRSVGGREFSNPVDWLEGLSVTTSQGRSVGFGCLAPGAPPCTGVIAVSSTHPPGYPDAYLAAFRGQYGMLVTSSHDQNTPCVINFLSFRWASN